jgi:hypothetical protein
MPPYDPRMTTPGYPGKPLAAKLGIKAEHVVLDGAPEGFATDGLPAGTTIARRAGRTPYEVVLAFCPDQARLAKRLPGLKLVRRLADR